MKKFMILGVIMLFLFCAPKKTTVKTEGLEEVVVFGEEEKNVSEEPVYPAPSPTTAKPSPIPPEVSATPLPAEEAVTPLPIEEVSVAPAPATTPLPIEEVSTPAPLTPAPATITAPATIYGFRVQIFVSSTQKGAIKVADDARGLFGGKVYIEHTPPYYKVRVGDCLTKEEAETLKNLAINKGFRGAFVVETMITP